MPQQPGSYFHLHMVSDATGETLITVARAAAAQYAKVSAIEHVYPLVRTAKQLERVLSEIEESPGVVLYTLLEEDLVGRLEQKCRELGLPCLSILGPVLQLFQSYLGSEKSQRIGAQHVLNAEYFKRIDALNFTMLHDDGQNADGFENADVVLVGVVAHLEDPDVDLPGQPRHQDREYSVDSRYSTAAAVGNLKGTVGGRSVRESGANRADPPKPAAWVARASR